MVVAHGSHVCRMVVAHWSHMRRTCVARASHLCRTYVARVSRTRRARKLTQHTTNAHANANNTPNEAQNENDTTHDARQRKRPQTNPPSAQPRNKLTKPSIESCEMHHFLNNCGKHTNNKNTANGPQHPNTKRKNRTKRDTKQHNRNTHVFSPFIKSDKSHRSPRAGQA